MKTLPSSSVLLAMVISLGLAACGGSSEGTEGGAEAARETTPVAVTEAATPERSLVTASDEQEQRPEVFGIDSVIRFDPGGTSATISDAVVRGEHNRYTLEAAAGQTMNVDVVSLEDNAVFDVLGPDGAVLVAGVTTASIALPADGVYTLILGGTRGNASYDLTVEIPAG